MSGRHAAPAPGHACPRATRGAVSAGTAPVGGRSSAPGIGGRPGPGSWAARTVGGTAGSPGRVGVTMSGWNALGPGSAQPPASSRTSTPWAPVRRKVCGTAKRTFDPGANGSGGGAPELLTAHELRPKESSGPKRTTKPETGAFPDLAVTCSSAGRPTMAGGSSLTDSTRGHALDGTRRQTLRRDTVRQTPNISATGASTVNVVSRSTTCRGVDCSTTTAGSA